jgi:hypothetical protein
VKPCKNLGREQNFTCVSSLPPPSHPALVGQLAWCDKEVFFKLTKMKIFLVIVCAFAQVNDVQAGVYARNHLRGWDIFGKRNVTSTDDGKVDTVDDATLESGGLRRTTRNPSIVGSLARESISAFASKNRTGRYRIYTTSTSTTTTTTTPSSVTTTLPPMTTQESYTTPHSENIIAGNVSDTDADLMIGSGGLPGTDDQDDPKANNTQTPSSGLEGSAANITSKASEIEILGR